MNRAQFRELVGIAIGEASMCWSEIPKGVFDSTKACELVDRIVDAFPLTEAELDELHSEAARELGW